MEENLKWMEEKIEKLPNNNWWYKLICFLLFRRKTKLTFKELYMILENVNMKTIPKLIDFLFGRLL